MTIMETLMKTLPIKKQKQIKKAIDGIIEQREADRDN